MSDPSEVTQLIIDASAGDRRAAEALLPLVYEQLRAIAQQRMSAERPGHTLQATALVHEAYIRLVDVEKAQHWNSRGHFFGAAAEAMRRILVESARRKARLKHGGGRERREVCFSEHCLAAFRKWLRTQYPDLDALNKEWDTAFDHWVANGQPGYELAEG